MIAILDWNEAFDVCRERNRPLVIEDKDGKRTLIFPSGHEKATTRKADFVIDPEAFDMTGQLKDPTYCK